jgi:hypothetical protein
MTGYFAASTRFNQTICGSEPVGNGSAFWVSGGSGAVGIAAHQTHGTQRMSAD